MKKNRIILSTFFIIFFILITINYYKFLFYKKTLSSGVFFDLEHAYCEYSQSNDSININLFMEFLKNEVKYKDLHTKMNKLYFGITERGDSLYFYEFGFNKTNDNGFFFYNGNDIGFINSFFKKGNLLFLVVPKKCIKKNAHEDRPPPPPIPPIHID